MHVFNVILKFCVWQKKWPEKKNVEEDFDDYNKQNENLALFVALEIDLTGSNVMFGSFTL